MGECLRGLSGASFAVNTRPKYTQKAWGYKKGQMYVIIVKILILCDYVAIPQAITCY